MDRDLSKDLGRTTAGNLRKQLDALPDDAPIFVRGYEGGYFDAGKFSPVTVALNVHSEWYYGTHDEPTKESEQTVVDGFVI